MRRSQALFCTVWRPLLGVSGKDRILLANPHQSSRSTFSWESFPSFFAFKEGMWDTQILVGK